MSIFKIVLIALTVTPLFSNAQECRGVARNGMPVYVSTKRVYQDNLANVRGMSEHDQMWQPQAYSRKLLVP